jgi:hypothetical protein
MYRHLTRNEQLELADTLQGVVLRVKAADADKQQPDTLEEIKVLNSKSGEGDRGAVIQLRSPELVPPRVMVRHVFGGVTGAPVIRRLEVVRLVFNTFVVFSAQSILAKRL